MLLEKNGKDRRLIQNWRPISLLNADYKIGTKCLAKRMERILPGIIHESQTAFVKNRFIGDNVRLIDSLLHYTALKDIPGLLMTVDFEKVFDKLEWPYLYKVLKTFNFGPSFIQWIKSLYTNIMSCVMNRGTSTGYFNIHRGVRQGDPISPMLFILSLEIFLIAMRSDNDIKGIIFGNEECKSVSYADDLSCFLRDLASATNVFNLLNDFKSISG